MIDHRATRAASGRLSPHFSKKGPGRIHYQGNGHKPVPLAQPTHAIDCELNDHPSYIYKRQREGIQPSCNCFVERKNREFIELDSFGKVRDNSMRAHIGSFGEVQ